MTESTNQGVTRVERDLLGRPTLIETPEVPNVYPSRPGNTFAQRTTLDWDSAANGVGELHVATSNDGVRTEFGFDGFGRPASQTWRVGGIDYQLATSRNALGQVETLWYPANPRYRYTPSGPVPILGTGEFGVRYTYASNGQVRKVTEESTGLAIWEQQSRNVFGQSKAERFGSSIQVDREYDDLARLRLVRGQVVGATSPFQLLSYRWGKGDVLNRRVDVVTGSAEDFEHDFLQRLTKWTVAQNCQTTEWRYGVDEWGNQRTRTGTRDDGTIVGDLTLMAGVNAWQERPRPRRAPAAPRG